MDTNAPPDARQITVNLVEQMDLYDRLPAELRLLVDVAPIPMDLREVQAVLAKFGLASSLQLISQVLSQEYPGWSFAGVTKFPNLRHRFARRPR